MKLKSYNISVLDKSTLNHNIKNIIAKIIHKYYLQNIHKELLLKLSPPKPRGTNWMELIANGPQDRYLMDW